MPATGKAKGSGDGGYEKRPINFYLTTNLHHHIRKLTRKAFIIICYAHIHTSTHPFLHSSYLFTIPPFSSSSSSSSSSSLMHIIAHLFMQNPNTKSATTRKPWYQRAMHLWKLTYPKSTNIPPSPDYNTNSPPTLRKNLSTAAATRNNIPIPNNIPNRQKLRKSTSLKVATSFTRVCLCVPISSYTEVFQAELAVAPRRSNTYPRSKPFPNSSSSSSCTTSSSIQQEHHRPRMSTEGRRRIFRGKSLTDDVLMRRFVVEEEAMMQVRRRNEMEVIRKRNAKRRRRSLGPSPLSRMVLAEEPEEENGF